ncbi:MAG: hypothetical protein JWR63_4301, partial [Conexibacter sp.]|nr:hypothetical protein [Conexibacter sp.]
HGADDPAGHHAREDRGAKVHHAKHHRHAEQRHGADDGPNHT